MTPMLPATAPMSQDVSVASPSVRPIEIPKIKKKISNG